MDVLTGVSGANERRFSLKPTQFSRTGFSLAPDKRPNKIPDPEGGYLRWAEVTHTYIQMSLSGLQVQRTLISAERSSRRQKVFSIDRGFSKDSTPWADGAPPEVPSLSEDFLKISD